MKRDSTGAVAYLRLEGAGHCLPMIGESFSLLEREIDVEMLLFHKMRYRMCSVTHRASKRNLE